MSVIPFQNPNPEELIDESIDGIAVWSSDDFMKPVLDDDGLLQFGVCIHRLLHEHSRQLIWAHTFTHTITCQI